MFLSSADLPFRWFHYARPILFFHLHTDQKQQPLVPSSSAPFFAHLKSSLALALVDFFPFAGRLFEQDDGRLSLDCNDAGVPFIEACIDLPFSSLKDDGFKHQPFFDCLAPLGDVIQWTGPDLPLLSIQVTRFREDEGFALGFAASHVVADGSSFFHFLKSWGEYTRGVPLSMHPLHMREELHREKLLLPSPSPQSDEKAGNILTSPLSRAAHIGGEQVELVQRDFHFTPEMVKKLKHMASVSAPADQHAPISSLQALSAHIWRHIILAAATDHQEDKTRSKSVFHLLANVRSRLVPPLPEAYFGNAIMRITAMARREELEQESLGATALRIQELISRIDDKLVREFLGGREVLPFRKPEYGEDYMREQLILAGSPHMPVYEVDFGWGKPLCIRCARIHGNGEMMWFPGREGEGSIDVDLALTKTAMEKLEHDTSFLCF